jgi:hypothetical protein
MPVEEEYALPKFKILSERIYELIIGRLQN